MNNQAIGIDLGTSTSEICIFRNDQPYPIPDPASKSPIVPSLVSFQRNGETVVGEPARKLAYSEERGVFEVKRKMGTDARIPVTVSEYEQKRFRPEEISALILRKLKETAEGTFNISVKDVVITVPANFKDAAREATKNAAEIAGLNVLRLINEPTAAALAFGINNLDLEEQMIVFDFGGGTLDITILEMIEGVVDIKCSFGDPCLGGKDIDEALIQLVISKFKKNYPLFTHTDKYVANLKRPCELAKIELSSQLTAQVYLANFYVDAGSPVDLDLEITRAEFEQAIQTVLEKAKACIRETLKSKELRPSSIQRVLLVGGSTYIPAVRKLVSEMFGKEPSAGVHPDLAVAMGASIQAALLKGHIDDEKGIILTDCVPYSLGIDIVTQVGYQEVLAFMPLIERNTKIPYSARYEHLALRYTDQDSLKFSVYQDHSGRAQFPHECEDTGKGGEINKIPKSHDGTPHRLVVDFSYDSDGLAVIKASLPATGQILTVTHGKSANRMDADEVAEAAKNISELWKKNDKAKNFEVIIEKAERLASNISGSERQRLEDTVERLKQALTRSDDSLIMQTSDSLIDLMYDMES